jgi:hypothetical protein
MQKENDMKRKPKDKPVEAIHTDMVSDAVKMAANNYMLVNVSVSFWDGIGKFEKAAAKAAKAAGAEEEGTRLYKDLMGGNKSHLDAVNRKHRRLRTYLNEEALQTAPKQKGRDRRGKKMLHINRIPEVLGRLKELSAIADAAADSFCEDYEKFRDYALSTTFGSWRTEAASLFPTVEDVRLKFHASISHPEPIPAIDMKRFGSIPAEMLGRIVEASNAAIATQLETAKHDAINRSLVAAEKALKQLTTGKRLHQAVIDNVVREATKLQEIADGYDKDPRVKNIAKSMLTEVANVSSVESWKNSETAKLDAKTAADIAVKNLRRMTEAPAIAPQPVSTTAEELIVPDAISDLI